MAEGMQGISRAQAAFHAQQHQELIARIRSRMESLCQHCRAASDGRSYILENGDGEIGNDCNVHNFFRSMRRGCLFRVGNHSQLQVLRLTAPALMKHAESQLRRSLALKRGLVSGSRSRGLYPCLVL